jgi:hypothetical protein
MAEDREHEQTLRRHVAEIVALESDIERALEHQLEEVHAHPETAAVVRHKGTGWRPVSLCAAPPGRVPGDRSHRQAGGGESY